MYVCIYILYRDADLSSSYLSIYLLHSCVPSKIPGVETKVIQSLKPLEVVANTKDIVSPHFEGLFPVTSLPNVSGLRGWRTSQGMGGG
jgi:hypothetical protein